MGTSIKRAKIVSQLRQTRDQSRSSQRGGAEMNPDQQQLMNTLINFYNKGGNVPNQKLSGMINSKKISHGTQKLQTLNNTVVTSELYHKGARNSTSASVSKQRQAPRPTSQMQQNKGLNRINLIGMMNYRSQEDMRPRGSS